MDLLDAYNVELAMVQSKNQHSRCKNIHSDNNKSFKKLERKHENRNFTSPYASNYRKGNVKRTLAAHLGR